MVRLWLNVYISFFMLSLRIATYLGFIFSGVGFLGIVVLFVRKIAHINILSGYTSTLIVVLLMSGVIIIMIGVIGEYLGRIYMTVSGMPQYNIRRVVGVDDENSK